MLTELAEAVKDAARADVSKMRRSVVLARAGARRSARRRLSSGARRGSSVGHRGLRDRRPSGPAADPRHRRLDGRDRRPQLDRPRIPRMDARDDHRAAHASRIHRLFAEALNRICEVEVKEAEDGDEMRPGLVLVAPGDLHAKVVSRGGRWKVSCVPGPKVSGHRPSADVLFSSVAEVAGDRALGLLLTGMGRDGAVGLLQMRKAGGRCFAQDEASSVVFGMPKEAWELGAAERLVSLDRVVPELLACLSTRASKPRAAGGRG